MARCFYYKLKGALIAAGYNGQETARALLISPATYSLKLNGKYPWTLDEMYTQLDLIGCGYDKMSEYFPDRRK